MMWLEYLAGARNREAWDGAGGARAGWSHNGTVLILHACLTEPGCVRVWGEDSAAAREVRPARGRPARNPKVKPHPYAASFDRLADVAAASSTPVPALELDEEQMVLVLPSGKRGPAPSTGAVEVATGNKFADMWLAPWSVPSFRINLGLAAEDLVLGTEPAGQVMLGDSWRWLTKLARFSLEAVAAGRAIPSHVELPVEAGIQAQSVAGEAQSDTTIPPRDDPAMPHRGDSTMLPQGDPKASPPPASLLSWRPILSPVDHSRLRSLATALPPSMRARELVYSEDSEQRVPAPLADLVEVAFLVLTDALVRRNLREFPVPSGNSVGSWLVRALTAHSLEYLDVGQVPIRRRALAELSEWQESFEATDDSIRVCFRLLPPPMGEPSDDELGRTVGSGGELGKGSGHGSGDGSDDNPDHSSSSDFDGGSDSDSGTKDQDRVAVEDADDDRWVLEILLQSTDDPSLIVPMSDIWNSGADVADTLGGSETQVLESLGRASRTYPALDEALQSATPSRMDLTTQGAVDFLTAAAVDLEEAGFGVLVPQTLRGAPRARVQPKRSTPSDGQVMAAGFGLDELVEFDWDLALGDQSIDLAELERLAELKAPLVRLRGKWVHVEPDEIASLVAAIERQSKSGGPRATVRELIHAGLGLGELDVDVPVEVGGDDTWLRDLVAGSLGVDVSDYQSSPTPGGIDGVLRDYQERGLGWLAFMDRLGLGACLADDMGLGKTIQLLALLVTERESAAPVPTPAMATPPARTPGPTLLVAPMSLVGNWQKEAARFAPGLSVYVHHGVDRASEDFVERVAEADIVLTTYAIASRDQETLARVGWGRIVLDEAQNIKNARTKASVALRGLDATTRIALTGTPVENRLSELWSILDFCNPGLLGPAKTFHDKFAIPIERYQDVAATRLLSDVVGPFILRRAKTDPAIAAGLPEKTEIKAYCTLTKEQASLYKATVDDLLAKVEESEGITRRGLVLAMMLRLKQVCNHPAQLLADNSGVDGRSGKLAYLEETLTEVLAVGEKALVFTQFVEMGQMLTRHLAEKFGVEVLFLHGSVSRPARDAMVQSFNSDDGPPIFVLSLKAGGVGLNLTAANHVVHFDRWWNPAVEDQASDRAFRIGQTRNVQVRKLICSGTLEDRIDEMIDRKKALAGSVISSGEGWLTELSTAELADVIALGRDAVMEA